MDASQTTSDFKGDHLSAKMFSVAGNGIAGISRMLFNGAAMSAGSPIVSTGSNAFFLPTDVGNIITVQGAGTSGATLVGTVLTYTDAFHITASVSASTNVSGKIAFVGIDETTVINSLLIPPGSDGSRVNRLLPTGNYFVTPGSISVPNPQSGMLIGQGERFNSVLVSNTPSSTSPILQLGDGTNEPHSYVLEKLSIDANGGGPLGALFFTRVNLMVVRDISIQGIGVNGVGITNPSTELLFGEMIFDHVEVLGVDGTVPTGSIGMQIYATGNVDLFNCNIEQIETGLIFTGASQVKLTFIGGGHIERISLYAMILNNCQPTIDCDAAVGSVWLGSDVVNANINLTNTSFLWPSGAVVDNGFGNHIRKTSSSILSPGTHSAYATGIAFDGDEWLSVPGIVDDPTFLSGVGTWGVVGASVARSNISMPGVKSGASMTITDSGSGGGHASRTFTAIANTDYLLQVGVLTQGTNVYRIVVSNSTTTVWDSGSLTYPLFGEGSDQQSFKVIRKSIPVTSDTMFTVTIYGINANQVTIIPLLLISQSVLVMATGFSTTGTGFSSSGSGSALTFNQNIGTGTVFSATVQSFSQRCFARAVVTVPSGVTAYIGLGGNGNDPTTGPQVPLRAGITAEYILPLASFPFNSILDFYSFVSSGVIQIQDIGLYLIDDPTLAPYLIQTPYTGLTKAIPLTSGLLSLGNANAPALPAAPTANIQTDPTSGNGFKRVIYASNIIWNQSTGVWDVGTNGGSDWAALVMLNSGIIALACEVGLTLPTTRTETQFTAAIRWQVTPTGVVTQINGADSFNLNVGSGSPLGVVSGGIGDLYVDITNGNLWIDKTGGTPGWVNVSGVTPGSITLADLANIPADTVIGNNNAISATPVALTQAQLTALINIFSSSLAGLVPGSGGGSANFLRADGNWEPAGAYFQNFSFSGTIPNGYATYFIIISAASITVAFPVVASVISIQVRVRTTFSGGGSSVIQSGSGQTFSTGGSSFTTVTLGANVAQRWDGDTSSIWYQEY